MECIDADVVAAVNDGDVAYVATAHTVWRVVRGVRDAKPLFRPLVHAIPPGGLAVDGGECFVAALLDDGKPGLIQASDPDVPARRKRVTWRLGPGHTMCVVPAGVVLFLDTPPCALFYDRDGGWSPHDFHILDLGDSVPVGAICTGTSHDGNVIRASYGDAVVVVDAVAQEVISPDPGPRTRSS